MLFGFFLDSLQAQLINMGVIPTLVKLLGVHSQNTPLTEMCLVAFGNLAELGKYPNAWTEMIKTRSNSGLLFSVLCACKGYVHFCKDLFCYCNASKIKDT